MTKLQNDSSNNSEMNEKKPKLQKVSVPTIGMDNIDYSNTLSSQWFSDDFYRLLAKYNFSIILKNKDTGKKTFIRTFGARFPVLIDDVA